MKYYWMKFSYVFSFDIQNKLLLQYFSDIALVSQEYSDSFQSVGHDFFRKLLFNFFEAEILWAGVTVYQETCGLPPLQYYWQSREWKEQIGQIFGGYIWWISRIGSQALLIYVMNKLRRALRLAGRFNRWMSFGGSRSEIGMTNPVLFSFVILDGKFAGRDLGSPLKTQCNYCCCHLLFTSRWRVEHAYPWKIPTISSCVFL